MRYQLVALPMREDLAYYRDVGRGVAIQWLHLTPRQATELSRALALNARPEHAHYDYDYFTDNCATRVRDAIDRALGRGAGDAAIGAFARRYLSQRGSASGIAGAADVAGLRHRAGAVRRHAAVRVAGRLRADAPARWPARGQGHRRHPLVDSEQVLLQTRIAPEPRESPRPWWPWLLWGMAIAIGLGLLARSAPRTLAATALACLDAAGLVGLLMAFIWMGTRTRRLGEPEPAAVQSAVPAALARRLARAARTARGNVVCAHPRRRRGLRRRGMGHALGCRSPSRTTTTGSRCCCRPHHVACRPAATLTLPRPPARSTIRA